MPNSGEDGLAQINHKISLPLRCSSPIAGGSSQSKEAGYLHRKGELLELKDYLASERKVLRDAKNRYEDDEAKRVALAENINRLQKDWQELSLLLAQKKVEFKQLEKLVCKSRRYLKSYR